MPAALRESILAVLPESATAVGEFLWPADLYRPGWAGFRRHRWSADRPLEHIAPEEIGNAMVALSRAGAGRTRNDLFRATLAVFGHRRPHPVLFPLLEAALSQALVEGRLTDTPSGLMPAAPR